MRVVKSKAKPKKLATTSFYRAHPGVTMLTKWRVGLDGEEELHHASFLDYE
jgi:hypothetical protein